MNKFLGYAIVFLGVVVIVLISKILNYRKSSKPNKSLLDLKKNGEKLTIQFEDCEIKTREYFEATSSDSFPTRIEMLDSLYNPNRSYEGTKKVISVLIYKYKDSTGKSMEFRSDSIEMPLETLRYILVNRKTTTIFFDKANWNRYYFDLGFVHA